MPLNPQQALVRRLSVINLENLRRQYARQRWKMSIKIVALCVHLSRLTRRTASLQQQDSPRSCESDQEREIKRRRPRTRKRSNTS